MSLYVGVAGASRPEAALLDQAEMLGRRLAEAGAVVVCGGGPGAHRGGPERPGMSGLFGSGPAARTGP